jgi:hypothetical protein
MRAAVKIGPIAVHHRPLQKKADQTPSLRPVQLQRSSWRETHSQCLGSTSPSGVAPTHHRTWIAADAPSHFVKRLTRIQQRQGTLAPILE